MNVETNKMDEMLLSDPEHAIGFDALGTSIEIFYRWFSMCARAEASASNLVIGDECHAYSSTSADCPRR